MRSRYSCERIRTQLSPSHCDASDLGSGGIDRSIAAWFAGASFLWVVGGLLLGAVIPFTLIVILPTNKQLLNPALDKHSRQTGQLLARWGRLHAVRTVLSTTALLLFLYLAIFKEDV